MPARNAAAGGEAALCAASRFSFFKVEMPWRIKRVSFCALRLLPGEQFFFLPSFFFLGLRLLPGAGSWSPARRGAWGERGRGPAP